MKKFTIGLSLAALAIGGAALAAQGSGMMRGGATVTRADMQAHATQAFERLDANRDGKIDPADREARRAAMFDTIDADHNGQITKAEFLAHKPAWGKRDGAGAEGAGMGMHRGGGHGMRGHGMGRMMQRMADSNGDGAVTREEFTASMAQHFDRMDANKDGQVTPEERRAMRQSMRGHKGQQMDGPGAPAPETN